MPFTGESYRSGKMKVYPLDQMNSFRAKRISEEEMSGVFIEFLEQEMEIDVDDLSPEMLRFLFEKCYEEIREYTRDDDSVSRDNLYDEVSRVLYE